MSDSFIHPRALCESPHIGAGTRIWAFAHVLAGARLGDDCNICDGVFIENDVILGDRVTVKCGVQLWDGVRLADDVFVGPNVTFANDKFPRSRAYQEHIPETVVDVGASLGANCTILPGLRIGRRAMVGAGGVVTGNVPPFAIVTGNPARIMGYVDRSGRAMPPPAPMQPSSLGGSVAVIPGVTLHTLRGAEDTRGMITIAEVGADIPFPVQPSTTTFRVEVVASGRFTCQQFMICMRGSVALKDSGNMKEVTLDRPGLGIHVRDGLDGVVSPYLGCGDPRRSPASITIRRIIKGIMTISRVLRKWPRTVTRPRVVLVHQSGGPGPGRCGVLSRSTWHSGAQRR